MLGKARALWQNVLLSFPVSIQLLGISFVCFLAVVFLMLRVSEGLGVIRILETLQCRYLIRSLELMD